jgi:heme/copper-type cytochrome/quinol oxidase subunit 2
MTIQDLWREIVVSLLTVAVITAIVAFIFVVIYPFEKRKGNLRLGEIIKNLLKKLV